jgi:hypothetical protein
MTWLETVNTIHETTSQMFDIRINSVAIAVQWTKRRMWSLFTGDLGELFLQDSGFGSEFNDESIAPLVLCIHQLGHLLSQFGLFRRIDSPAQPHILVAVHFERDSGMVLDVPNPVRLIPVLRDEIESSLMSDVPDFYSVRCLSLPAFSSKIEKLVFAVLQKPLL